MNTSPLVSFCMSTYKRPAQLKAQLEGIISQEYKNIEIIVSDNDPDGSGREAAESISDSRIKYYANAENLGMVKSFNKSISRSKGDFIVMVTDDDPVYPEMLSILLDLRAKHSGYGVYAGCGDWIVETEFSAHSLKEHIGVKKTILKEFPEGEIVIAEADLFPVIYLEGLFSKTFLLWSCCMVERDVIDTIKGMPDYGSELLTDHAYIIAASSQKGMVFINKGLGGQSIRGDNFGFDFERVKDKYLTTPGLFYNYLKPHLERLDKWEVIEKKLWNFIGRGWVEYSLMIFRSLKEKGKNTKEFFSRFNSVFKNPRLIKWKYKFYLKAYFGKTFKLLIKLKPR